MSVQGTDWIEPVIVWLTVGMPTGCGKSSVFRYLLRLIGLTRKKLHIPDGAPSWSLDEATFEKMGALMSDNGGRLLGIYDEMTTFLTQINLYRSRGLADSHDVAVFLQLYNGHPWSRKTGKCLLSAHMQLNASLLLSELLINVFTAVTGEANFTMEQTSLIVGGFTQPITARALIEQQGSAEKGLSQRFLGIFPKPRFAAAAQDRASKRDLYRRSASTSSSKEKGSRGRHDVEERQPSPRGLFSITATSVMVKF